MYDSREIIAIISGGKEYFENVFDECNLGACVNITR
jgi:hypothetical protein